MAKDIFLRVLAVFVLDALGTIGGASIFGIDAVTAASVAGILALAVVFQDLARAFLADGKLTKAEVNEIFKKAAEEDK
jgi:polysaccharide deacetylase 2 family uncharacterized protein YibQ